MEADQLPSVSPKLGVVQEEGPGPNECLVPIPSPNHDVRISNKQNLSSKNLIFQMLSQTSAEFAKYHFLAFPCPWVFAES
jgi:hypothetical protein